MFTTLQVAAACKAAAIKVLDIVESREPELEDDMVILTKQTHIQVGQNYLCLVRENEDKSFSWLHETESLPNMIYFIRSQLMLGKL